MPVRPPRPCPWPGCPALVLKGSHCAKHLPMAEARTAEARKNAHKAYNAQRDESDQFYKTERWRKFRAYYLRRHPLCVHCDSQGLTTVAVILDHIEPLKLRPDLALAWDNVRPLCRACHNRIGEKVGLIGAS